MSLSPAVIDALVAAGCTVEQLAAAMKASLAEHEHRAAEKRTKDAERQRKHRQRHALSRDVTVTNGDSVTEPSLSLPPNENNSNPPTHTHPDKQTRARKGTRLPADWEPEPLAADLTTEVSAWPDGAIQRELARFRDWADSATGPNAIKTNWQAAWRNWVRKAHDEGRYGRPIRANGGTDHRSIRLRAVDEALTFLGP